MEFEIYGGKDPRYVPAYSIGMAAFMLGVPVPTLRTWVDKPITGKRLNSPSFGPLIKRPSGSTSLSFINLIEGHVLASMRQRYNVKLVMIRRAVDHLRAMHPDIHHPLAEQEFQTDGVSLVVQEHGKSINVSKGGQLGLEGIIEAYLQRVERDDSGLPVRLFPFVRRPNADAVRLHQEPRLVVIDPRISFGKPVISGTGIPVMTIAERYKAGDTIQDLMDDFSRSSEEIEEAIRYELRLRAA